MAYSILIEFCSEEDAFEFKRGFMYVFLISLEEDKDFNLNIDVEKWCKELGQEMANKFNDTLRDSEAKWLKKENEMHSNMDRDYFDAMTDGQLGNYDDFIERGGDTGDLNDWAGR